MPELLSKCTCLMLKLSAHCAHLGLSFEINIRLKLLYKMPKLKAAFSVLML